MNQRIIFFIATLSIGIGILGLIGFFQSQQTTELVVSDITYQVAQLTTPLEKGDSLERDNIRYSRISGADALSKGITQDIHISYVPGMVATRELTSSSIIKDDDFVSPGNSRYINTIATEGKVPYPLTINNSDYLSSGIVVGDYVDLIILTSNDQNIAISKGISSFRSLKVSHLFRNVRILAVNDQNINENALPLTIELNRKQIAKMVIARRIGIIEIIKSSNDESTHAVSLNANTHDLLPNIKSVVEIRGERAFLIRE